MGLIWAEYKALRQIAVEAPDRLMPSKVSRAVMHEEICRAPFDASNILLVLWDTRNWANSKEIDDYFLAQLVAMKMDGSCTREFKVTK